MDEPHAGRGGLAEEHVEHRPRRIGHGKQLPRVGLAVELHARLGEEPHGVGHREPPEHLADRGGRAAGVVGLAHRVVRDVAAATAGHQDLGAELLRSVHRHDRKRTSGIPRGAARPGGREQAGGPGTDDEHVGGRWHGRTAARRAHRYHR
jgi:hypothetical protein